MASLSLDAWEAKWREEVAGTFNLEDSSYVLSLERLKSILRGGLLRNTDIRDNPERFFLAHRALAELATKVGPGFWIRFTVHFNLFSGSIMALGSPEHIANLAEMQKAGKAGCFGLTEVLAGVNSGLVVKTTCTYHPDRQMFLLHSPDKGAHKNWISAGLCADMCVVVADLHVGGRSFGPHAFVMELRRSGELVEGVEMGDMGPKSVGNDLDNAWISFSNVWLPKSALLNRYGDVEGDQYVQKVKGIRNMDMIGQRLYTGRTVIARAALVFTRTLYASTRKYTDNKRCWEPKGSGLTLSGVPQLQSLYAEAETELSKLETFLGVVERQLLECLHGDTLPSSELVGRIAVAKVKCVESAIALTWRLKQEVGSYALMNGCGFEQLDFLQCCKFAEGDSRVLMQKMSRDRLKAFQNGARVTEDEASACNALLAAVDRHDNIASHVQLYRLAQAVIDHTVDFVLSGQRARL